MKEKLMLQLEPLIAPFIQRVEQELLPRYRQLEPREQHLVLAAAVLLPVMIMLFGVLLPLQDRQHALHQELVAVQNQATEAETIATYLLEHGVKGKNGPASENMMTTVERLARQTGVRKFMTRIKPQITPDGGEKRLMISMKDVPYDATLRFIHALAKHHIGLNRLKLQAADSPGHIHVRAVLSGI